MNYDGIVRLVESLKGFVIIIGVLIGSFAISWREAQNTAYPLVISVYWLSFTSMLVTYYFFNRSNVRQGKVIDEAVRNFSEKVEDAITKLDETK